MSEFADDPLFKLQRDMAINKKPGELWFAPGFFLEFSDETDPASLFFDGRLLAVTSGLHAGAIAVVLPSMFVLLSAAGNDPLKANQLMTGYIKEAVEQLKGELLKRENKP